MNHIRTNNSLLSFTDLFASDLQYGGAPIWVKNAASCQAACIADPHCYAWTLNTPVTGSTEGYCYLKSKEKNCEAAVSDVFPSKLAYQPHWSLNCQKLIALDDNRL
jgi:hypothetical protein